MADNVELNAGSGGATIATDDIGGIQHELVKIEFGVDGAATMVSAADPLPVTDAGQQTDALTDAELRAVPVPISGTVNANTGLAQGLTDAQLRATPVPVSGTVTVDTSLLATVAKQDEQTALITTLNSLVENLNSLVSVLKPLGGAMNSGAPGLRVTPTAATLPISGTVTATVATTSITNFGTGIPAKEMADDINNFVVTLANINNVTS